MRSELSRQSRDPRRSQPNRGELGEILWPPPATRTGSDHERVEKPPLLLRHYPSNLGRSPKKAELNQRLGDLEIHFVNKT